MAGSDRRRAACPECGRPATAEQRPFCSRRCRLLDLGAWLGGRRGIPVRDEEREDEDDRPSDPEGDGTEA